MIIKHRVVFPPETVVNGKTRSDLPVVLGIERVVFGIRVSIGNEGRPDVHAARNSEQERCKGVPDDWTSDGIGEVIAPEPPASEHGSEERCEVPEVTTHFPCVLPAYPRQVVEELKI